MADDRRVIVSGVELDHNHGGIVKINGLADWESVDVWDYVQKYDLKQSSGSGDQQGGGPALA